MLHSLGIRRLLRVTDPRSENTCTFCSGAARCRKRPFRTRRVHSLGSRGLSGATPTEWSSIGSASRRDASGVENWRSAWNQSGCDPVRGRFLGGRRTPGVARAAGSTRGYRAVNASRWNESDISKTLSRNRMPHTSIELSLCDRIPVSTAATNCGCLSTTSGRNTATFPLQIETIG